MKIQTSKIKIPAGKLISLLFFEYGAIWLGIAIFISLLLGSAAFLFNFKFLILSLIWIFIVVPMAILIIFLSYGLLPLTTYNTIPHSLKFDTERIKIEFLEEENEESKLKDKIIFYSDLIKIKRSSEFLILFFKNPVKGVLLIPFISLKDKTELEVLFNNLSESLTPIEQPA